MQNRMCGNQWKARSTCTLALGKPRACVQLHTKCVTIAINLDVAKVKENYDLYRRIGLILSKTQVKSMFRCLAHLLHSVMATATRLRFFSSGHVLAFMTLSFHVDDALELTAGKNRDAVHMSMGGRR